MSLALSALLFEWRRYMAAVMALDRAMRNAGSGRSVYEDRGITTIG